MDKKIHELNFFTKWSVQFSLPNLSIGCVNFLLQLQNLSVIYVQSKRLILVLPEISECRIIKFVHMQARSNVITQSYFHTFSQYLTTSSKEPSTIIFTTLATSECVFFNFIVFCQGKYYTFSLKLQTPVF